MSERRPGPVWPAIGRIIEPAYALAVRRRNTRFDRGRIPAARMPVPVISVGNLSVGGVGKTPMVMELVALLRERGQRPAIALRGYGARTDAGIADEQAEYLDRVPGVHLAVGPKRAETIPALLAAQPGEITHVLLDDGFQHRFVHRDVELVLIDATRSPFEDRLLPAGWLREPVDSLGRASAVVITHAESAHADELSRLRQNLASRFPQLPVALAEHRWAALTAWRDGQPTEEPVDAIAGQRVVPMLGVGNPGAFLASLERLGARPAATVVRRDHTPWAEADVARALGRAPADADIVTTAKDWVKLRAHQGALGARRVLVPRLEMGFVEGRSVIESLIDSTIRRTPEIR